MRRMAPAMRSLRMHLKQGACHGRDPITYQNGFNANSCHKADGKADDAERSTTPYPKLQHHSRTRAGAWIPSCFIFR